MWHPKGQQETGARSTEKEAKNETAWYSNCRSWCVWNYEVDGQKASCEATRSIHKSLCMTHNLLVSTGTEVVMKPQCVHQLQLLTEWWQVGRMVFNTFQEMVEKRIFPHYRSCLLYTFYMYCIANRHNRCQLPKKKKKNLGSNLLSNFCRHAGGFLPE